MSAVALYSLDASPLKELPPFHEEDCQRRFGFFLHFRSGSFQIEMIVENIIADVNSVETGVWLLGIPSGFQP